MPQPPRSRSTSPSSKTCRARQAVGHDRLERPGQPDVLRDLRLPEPLRLPASQGDQADARRAREGQGGGVQRHPRGDGARRRGDARLRPVGDVQQDRSRTLRARRRTRRRQVGGRGMGGGFKAEPRRVSIARPRRGGDPPLAGRADPRWSAAAAGSDPLERALGIGAAEATPPDDPVLARLFPDAYRDDRSRPSSAGTPSRACATASAPTPTVVLRTAGPGEDPADAEQAKRAWLRALNDVRLALGTRLGVTEESRSRSSASPRTTRRYAASSSPYDWLTYLQDSLVTQRLVASTVC